MARSAAGIRCWRSHCDRRQRRDFAGGRVLDGAVSTVGHRQQTGANRFSTPRLMGRHARIDVFDLHFKLAEQPNSSECFRRPQMPQKVAPTASSPLPMRNGVQTIWGTYTAIAQAQSGLSTTSRTREFCLALCVSAPPFATGEWRLRQMTFGTMAAHDCHHKRRTAASTAI